VDSRRLQRFEAFSHEIHDTPASGRLYDHSPGKRYAFPPDPPKPDQPKQQYNHRRVQHARSIPAFTVPSSISYRLRRILENPAFRSVRPIDRHRRRAL
jgi:hypothetical protein